jgi:AcrR family transcriptional regulator
MRAAGAGTVSAEPARRRGERARRSAEEVARAALEVLDREGIDALSMRRLADELGLGTMTLYGHFRSKRELLEAVVEVAVADFEPPGGGGDLRERARAHVLAVRRWLLRHPALADIRARQPILGAAPLRISERLMQELLDAGFPPAEAAHAFRLLFTYVFGFSMLNRAERSPEQQDAARAALRALPRDEFPALTAAAEGLADALGDEEQFEYGLERVLDGLEARLRARRAD